MAKIGFCNSPDDVQWLRETHLKGVPLPFAFDRFASFVLQGNDDAPHAVNLYASIDPNHDDNYFRVRFVNDSGAYAEACEYNGKTDKPLGGLASID